MVNNKNFILRLNKILKEYELTAANFADKIQVGRATISHILSGRNKPSLDFVLKIVHTFPQVDLYWLLEGKGSFPKTEELTSTTTPLSKRNQDDSSSKKRNTSQQDLTTRNTLTPISNKKIKRIIIFMEDGTFETYEMP